MNRRRFLATFFVGAPAAAVAHRLGWWAKVKTWLAKPPAPHVKPGRIDTLSREWEKVSSRAMRIPLQIYPGVLDFDEPVACDFVAITGCVGAPELWMDIPPGY